MEIILTVSTTKNGLGNTNNGEYHFEYFTEVNNIKQPLTSAIAVNDKTEFNISLKAAANFTITKVTSTPTGQLYNSDKTSTSVTITDIDTKEGDNYFAITVTDNDNNNAEIYCDPTVKNKARPPLETS